MQFKEKFLPNNNYIYFFFVLGCFGSFFDYLNYPLITLGINLTLLLILNQSNISLKLILNSIFIWVTGYLSFGFSKLVIATIITKDFYPLISGIGSFFTRISHSDQPYFTEDISLLKFQHITILDCISLNLNNFLPDKYIVISIIILFILYNIIVITKNFIKHKNINIKIIYPFLIVSTLPFIWLAIFVNHSYIHAHITYRILAIFIFAILAGLTTLRIESSKKDK